MPNYNWIGIDKTGQKISGTKDAPNFKTIKNHLIKKDIYPLKIRYSLIKNIFCNKIKPKHLHYFIEQLAILINANIQIIGALKIISKEIENKKIKSMIASCIESISSGNSLTQALEQHPQYFDPLICSTVNIGEQTGKLDIVLLELTKYIKYITLQNQKVVKALIYPIIVLVTAILVTIFMLTFVIPQLINILDNFNAQIPLYTKVIIKISSILQNNWKSLLGLIAIISIMIKTALKYSPSARKLLEITKYYIPFIKLFYIYATASRFTKNLSITIRAGLPLIKALHNSTHSITNPRYLKAIKNTSSLINAGHPLHKALSEQKIFPNKIIHLISIGEETAKLDLMLEKISDIYNEKLTNLIENLNTTLEPILILILGLIVGSLIIGIYLPIFRLGMAV